MRIFLIFFLGNALFLRMSTFGYFLVLNLIALKRRRPAPEVKDWPHIAIAAPLSARCFALAPVSLLTLNKYKVTPVSPKNNHDPSQAF